MPQNTESARDNDYAEQNAALVSRFYAEVLVKKDLEVADELLSPYLEVHSLGTPSEWHEGREGVKNMATALSDAFDDLSFAQGAMSVQGGKVETDWSVTGVLKSEFLGFKPTGKKTRISGKSVFLISPVGPGRRIAEFWDNWDEWGMLQRLRIEPIEG